MGMISATVSRLHPSHRFNIVKEGMSDCGIASFGHKDRNISGSRCSITEKKGRLFVFIGQIVTFVGSSPRWEGKDKS